MADGVGPHDHAFEEGDDETTPSGFARGAWRRRFEVWNLRPVDRRRLRSDIALALAHVVHPDEVANDPAFDSPLRILRAARAACERRPDGPNPIRDRVATWNDARKLTALTNALAALRLDRLAIIGNGLADWWAGSVWDAVAPTVARREREWFCALPGNKPPLTPLLLEQFEALLNQ